MQALLDEITKAQTIVLISHIHPDGDAVGSVYGLQLALERAGKKVSATLIHGVPEAFSFLFPHRAPTFSLELPTGADLCLVLDASDASRTGVYESIISYSKARKLGFIDHHPKGDLSRLAKAGWHNTDASSTCEMIAELTTELQLPLTSSAATALLTGMYTDTGGFQFSNTTPRTMELASLLMQKGANLRKIVRDMAEHKSVASLKLTGLALERLQICLDGACAVSFLTYEDMQEHGAKAEDIGGIIGELNVLPEVPVTLLMTEIEPGKVRGSLRTNAEAPINVGAFAKLLGGGGHPKASGFMLPGHLKEQAGVWQISPVQVAKTAEIR